MPLAIQELETLGRRFAPVNGESQVDFVDRVWDDLPGDSDIEKAKFCRKAWTDSGTDRHLQRIAEKRFPADQFNRVTGSAVFKEHETVRYRHDPVTGEEVEEPVVYDRDAIAAICDQCNKRIASTEDFAPLVDGHTPTRYQLDQGAKQPDVLGYAGPFYLGKLGGQFAIFADEHHQKDDAKTLYKKQRRSPEVWMKDISGRELSVDQRFFDPIACLGAETPRLDLGMTRYGRNCFEAVGADGAELMKYAAPAANSVYIPSDVQDEKREKYSGTEPMALQEQDIQQIIEAVSSMQQFQLLEELAPMLPQLRELVGGGGQPQQPVDGPDAGLDGAPDGIPAGGGEPERNALPMGEGDAPAEPMGNAGPPVDEEPEIQEEPVDYDPDDEDVEMLSRYMAGDCGDDEYMEYMAGKRSMIAGDDDDFGGDDFEDDEVEMPPKQNYSRRSSSSIDRYARENAQVKRQNAILAKRLAVIEADKRDAERYSRLSDARHQYAFDIDEQLDFTRTMDDRQFDKYMRTAIPNFSPIPLGEHVPVMPTPDVDRGRKKEAEEYQRKRSDWISEESERLQKKGEHRKWAELAEEYDAKHGAPAA